MRNAGGHRERRLLITVAAPLTPAALYSIRLASKAVRWLDPAGAALPLE